LIVFERDGVCVGNNWFSVTYVRIEGRPVPLDPDRVVPLPLPEVEVEGVEGAVSPANAPLKSLAVSPISISPIHSAEEEVEREGPFNEDCSEEGGEAGETTITSPTLMLLLRFCFRVEFAVIVFIPHSFPLPGVEGSAFDTSTVTK
jgi:hypothetical protein